MSNILLSFCNKCNKCLNLLCMKSIIFVDLKNKKIISNCKYPYSFAKFYAWKNNLSFLYRENGIYKLSIKIELKILPVILSIIDEDGNDLLENFINYLNVPIWIIIYNEKLNCKKINIEYMSDIDIKNINIDIIDIETKCLSDIIM